MKPFPEQALRVGPDVLAALQRVAGHDPVRERLLSTGQRFLCPVDRHAGWMG